MTLGCKETDRVGGGRVAEARMEFLRHAGAADNAAPLDNAHAQARHAEIGRAGEPIMAGADDNGVKVGHRNQSMPWSQHGRVYGDGRKSSSVEKERLHHALALDVDDTAPLNVVAIAEFRAGRGGDLNASRQRVGFHAARRIHGIAPDVIDEFVRADHAGHDRAAVDADARLKAERDVASDRFDRIEHARSEDGQCGRRGRAAPVGFRPPPYRHRRSS